VSQEQHITYFPRWGGGIWGIKYHYKVQGKLEIEDIKTVKGEDNDGNAVDIVVSRSTELKLVDEKTGIFKHT
jgi:hypothetical protein